MLHIKYILARWFSCLFAIDIPFDASRFGRALSWDDVNDRIDIDVKLYVDSLRAAGAKREST